MGWKGVLRSMAAADRRQRRATEKQLTALNRVGRKVDRIVDQLDDELARDLEKVARTEARIAEKPITTGGLTFASEEKRWSFKTLSDQTGDFTWTIRPSFTSDDVVVDSVAIGNGSRKMTALSFAATKWAIFVAFKLEEEDGEKRPKKLINKTDPNKSLVYLRTESGLLPGFDGDVDRQVGSGIGIIAFGLPEPGEVGTELTIEFHTTKPPATLSISSEDLHAIVEKARNGKSLVELAREAFEKKTAPVRQEARNQKAEIADSIAKAQNGGCGAMLAFVVIDSLIAVMSYLAVHPLTG